MPTRAGASTVAKTRQLFETDPVAMIRLFAVAQEHDRDIHPDAIKHTTRALKRIDDDVRHDAEANALFLEILDGST